MDDTRRKEKSDKGRSKYDFYMTRSASAAHHQSSFVDAVDSNVDRQKDDVQQNQPDYPKEPPTPYVIFVNNNKDKIVRKNPGMNSNDISAVAEMMYKTLSEKQKQKYVELARVAREKYRKQVQEFMEENPDLPRPVEISEKVEPPLVPTPFLIFCSKKKSKKSISWCIKKFPSLPDQERLKWIDLALAQEARYVEEFKKFKAENPHLKPKMTPVLNEEERHIVYMRDGKPPVKPHISSRHLFISEYQSISKNENGTPNRMAQWSASWKALSQEEKQIYKTRLNIMKQEYDAKWKAYLSKLPPEKRQEEIAKHHPVKKGEGLNKSSASSKKSVKKNSKALDKAENSIDGSNNISDDITLPNKLITRSKSAEESTEESSDESGSEMKRSNLPKSSVSILRETEWSALSKKAKFAIRNPSSQRDPKGSDPSSSSDDEPQKLSRASSSSSKSDKKMVPSSSKRSKIQSEEDTSEEDDSSEEEPCSMTSSSKTKNGIGRKGESTSTAVDSSYESYSDDSSKLSSYSSKFPIGNFDIRSNHQRKIPKCLTDDAMGNKRKKGAKVDKSGALSKKSKTGSGSKSSVAVDSSDESDDSDNDNLSNNQSS